MGIGLTQEGGHVIHLHCVECRRHAIELSLVGRVGQAARPVRLGPAVRDVGADPELALATVERLRDPET